MDEVIVTSPLGKLKGKRQTTCFNQKYYSFRGIPYAKPPVGNFRFKAPQPVEPWTDIKDATGHGPSCLSRDMVFKTLKGEEDCLFLNVYTPELPSTSSSPKPVMVWIHGGAFTSGSGNVELYSPDFLLREDVVLCTMNYRLGLLGFLSLEDPSLDVPGNAGLKDQVMALKWVQNNIAAFNGDPNNVTIFGESAGGTSVHYLMLSPMTKGLFHRAIAQSGCALGCRSIAKKSSGLIADTLKMPGATEKDILKVLMDLPASKILEVQEALPDPFTVNDNRPLGPVIEKPSADALITENPLDILHSGRFNQVPLIIGFTSREGMLGEIMTKAQYGEVKLVTNFEEAIPCAMNLPKESDQLKKIAAKIKEFYYGDEEPSLDNIDCYYKLHSDNFFIRPIQQTSKLHAANSTTPVFLYRMSIETDLNFLKKVSGIQRAGVAHADDIGYLFKNILTKSIRPGSTEDEAIRRFTKLWATFAKNGDPNCLNKDDLINVTWKRVEKGELNFLDIGENLTVGVNPEVRRMKFWDQILNTA